MEQHSYRRLSWCKLFFPLCTEHITFTAEDIGQILAMAFVIVTLNRWLLCTSCLVPLLPHRRIHSCT